MHGDVEIATVLAYPGCGCAAHGLRYQGAIGFDDAQTAGSFADEQAPIGQEGQAPRRIEPGGDHFDAHRLIARVQHLTIGIGHEGRCLGETAAALTDVGEQ